MVSPSKRVAQALLVIGVWTASWYLTFLVIREPVRWLLDALGADAAPRALITIGLAVALAIVVSGLIWLRVRPARTVPALGARDGASRLPATRAGDGERPRGRRAELRPTDGATDGGPSADALDYPLAGR